MTTVSVPEDLLAKAMRVADSKSPDEVVAYALEEYARRHGQAALVKYLGTSDGFYTAEELDESRRMD